MAFGSEVMANKRVIVSLVITAILLVALAYRLSAKSELEKIDDLVRSGLSKGATKQQVYDFLDSRSIRSSPYNAGPDPLVGLPSEDRQWSRYVTARVLKRSLAPWSPDYSIHIVFYFDENEGLTDYKLQKLLKSADSF
jgi:hypothetical protein